MVRSGRPASMMCLAAAVVIATPAPSSIAPVPWSQLSRALPARCPELAVAGAVLCRHHMVVDEDDLAPDVGVRRQAQRIDAVEIDDLAGDALWAGRTAVTERRNHQLLGEGRDDFGALGAA